jgi:transposase
VTEGLAAALERKKRSRSRTRKLDGEGEARLISLACSDAPEGYARWTLQMLADRLIALDVVETISHECVRQVLKKHHQTLAETDVVHTGTG